MRAKVLIAASIATAILVLDVGVVPASNLRITNAEKGFRIAFERFHAEISGLGGGSVTCQLTLTGTFEVATFAKRELTRVGAVDRAIPGTCERGTMRVLSETLPWSVRYRSFAGTLPNITTVTQGLSVVAFDLRPEGGLDCLIVSGLLAPLVLAGALSREGAMTSVEASGSFGGGASPCEATVRVEGRGTSTVLAESSAPTWRLITEEAVSAPVAPSLSGSGEFGRLEVEGVARRVITINAGTEAITPESIRVRSGNYFAITDPNRCIGSRIAVNGRCSFDAVFTAPSEAGRSVEDQLTVEGGLSALQLTLRGST